MKIKSDQEQSFLDFLLFQMDRLSELRIRRMFGGYGIYSGEFFFAIVHHGKLFFKTNETTKNRYDALKLPKFQPGKIALHYHLVPVDVIEDAEELTEWAKEAVGVAQAAYEAKLLKKRK